MRVRSDVGVKLVQRNLLLNLGGSSCNNTLTGLVPANTCCGVLIGECLVLYRFYPYEHQNLIYI